MTRAATPPASGCSSTSCRSIRGHASGNAIAQCVPAAERILENIAASTIDASQHQSTATTSIGVAEYADQTWSLDQLLAAAEAALADARKGGCNQAVCYLDDMQLVSGGAPVN